MRLQWRGGCVNRDGESSQPSQFSERNGLIQREPDRGGCARDRAVQDGDDRPISVGSKDQEDRPGSIHRTHIKVLAIRLDVTVRQRALDAGALQGLADFFCRLHVGPREGNENIRHERFNPGPAEPVFPAPLAPLPCGKNEDGLRLVVRDCLVIFWQLVGDYLIGICLRLLRGIESPIPWTLREAPRR